MKRNIVSSALLILFLCFVGCERENPAQPMATGNNEALKQLVSGEKPILTPAEIDKILASVRVIKSNGEEIPSTASVTCYSGGYAIDVYYYVYLAPSEFYFTDVEPCLTTGYKYQRHKAEAYVRAQSSNGKAKVNSQRYVESNWVGASVYTTTGLGLYSWTWASSNYTSCYGFTVSGSGETYHYSFVTNPGDSGVDLEAVQTRFTVAVCIPD